MGIKDRLREIPFIQDQYLVREFGSNIHDVDLSETIADGVEKRLIQAREMGIKYAVVLGGVIPVSKKWDRYGDGTWNPRRSFITTEDLKDPDNNRENERRNIYDFLRGKKAEKKEELQEMLQEEVQEEKPIVK